MNVGPTERIGRLASAGAGAGVADTAGAGAGVPLGLALTGRPFGGADICLARSSVTMISPCCEAAARSSMFLSASAQVWPVALQLQDGLNSWRYLKAVGSAV